MAHAHACGEHALRSVASAVASARCCAAADLLLKGVPSDLRSRILEYFQYIYTSSQSMDHLGQLQQVHGGGSICRRVKAAVPARQHDAAELPKRGVEHSRRAIVLQERDARARRLNPLGI